MTQPNRITFPRPNPDLNSTACEAKSLRPIDASLAVACPVCGHMACRVYIWTDDDDVEHEQPCEVCALIVYVRILKNRTDNGQDAIATINAGLLDHETRLNQGAVAIGSQGARLATAENTIATHTTQIGNRPTNAQANNAINNAVNPVDAKVDTLKTRVDNATEFPIP